VSPPLIKSGLAMNIDQDYCEQFTPSQRRKGKERVALVCRVRQEGRKGQIGGKVFFISQV